MKKKVHCLLKDESAAELIEAAIIYPVVILFLFFLIYIGLYIMQNMTVAAYSEKVAMLAAREVAHPGYLDMFVGGSDVFSNSAVEGDYGEAENANGIIEKIKVNEILQMILLCVLMGGAIIVITIITSIIY